MRPVTGTRTDHIAFMAKLCTLSSSAPAILRTPPREHLLVA
jgi:hypothetical protein